MSPINTSALAAELADALLLLRSPGEARALLAGHGAQAENDIVTLNTGALLMTAGKAATLRDAVDQTRDVLLSGQAGTVLDAYVEASNG